MSTTSAERDFTFIDSEASLLPLLNSINSLAVDPPSLYIDLEGIKLGRHGSISTPTLYIAPTKKTCFIDIRKLGEAAFSITSNNGTSLKTVLESPTIPKAFFDIRNNSDALFNLFQISVDGIKDLQLMELAARIGSRKFLSGLAGCIEKENHISAETKAEWRLIKERYQQLLNLKEGDRYRVFNERPPKLEIIEYYKQKVALLPALYNTYNAKLRKPGNAFWRVLVRQTTKDRIKLSQSSSYDGNSSKNAFGWDDWTIESEMESWNDDLWMEALAGTHVLNEDDEWVLRH